MTRYKGFFRLGALLLLVGWALALRVNAQQPWQLVQVDKGGVAEDVQLVYHDDPGDHQDQVWTACMNGGIYRLTWNSGSSAWNTNWTQYLPAKKAYGVDAVESGGTEYVLCTSMGIGIWYGSSPQSGFSPNWIRPNGAQQQYPSTWFHAGNHDAAFYWPVAPGGIPGGTSGITYTQQHFYVILTWGADGVDPGVYKWTSTSPYFVLVPNQPTPPHQYSHFYRDLNHREVLYVIKNPDESGGSITGCGELYRITGDYDSGSESFTQLTPTIAHPSNSLYHEVVGFNQWLDKTTTPYTVYSYILLHEVTGTGPTNDHYNVYVSTNLDNMNPPQDGLGLPIYTGPTESAPPLDLTKIYDYEVGYRVVGKPTNGLTYPHHLWLATGKYGMWYVLTNPSNPQVPTTQQQINDGNGEESHLKRWTPRTIIPDPDHIGTGEVMRILFGTHQSGVWYLKFSDLNVALDN